MLPVYIRSYLSKKNAKNRPELNFPFVSIHKENPFYLSPAFLVKNCKVSRHFFKYSDTLLHIILINCTNLAKRTFLMPGPDTNFLH